MQYKRLIQSLLVSLSLTGVCPETFAQPSPAILPAQAGEHVLFFTDRDLYATAEQILFTAFYSGPEDQAGNDLSQVLYVELVRWNGSRITGTKVSIREGGAGGTLDIPVELESGNYYLRAYTKWMRNYSPYGYSYLRLKIVNPTTMKTEAGPEEDSGPGKRIVPTIVDINDSVQFSGLKAKYGTREHVSLEIDASMGSSANKFLFGVVRKGTKILSGRSFTIDTPGTDEPAGALQYYPETRGHSLSGKVLEEGAEKPVPNARVNLSTVAEPLYFSTTTTDSGGVFLFTFPDFRGDHEFHIATEDEQNGKTELLIDNDFCTRPVTLPYHAFYLAADEKELVRELALNAQIRSRFETNAIQDDAILEDSIPFYGAPVRTLYEKEYIELKNMEEFFYELVYEVNVRRTDGKASLQMSSFGTLAGYPPLVLMDNIRIDNIDDLLNVSCRRVERIEVVSKGYVIGNQFYSGIISLYSEEHDMAGMKLGEENNFFTLSMPGKQAPGLSVPRDAGLPDHIPDRRNTLTWQAGLSLSAAKPYRTSFDTPDVPGTYTVYLAGTDGQGDSVMIATTEIIVEE